MTKSVAEKLLVKAGSTVWLSDPDLAGPLGDLPPGAVVQDTPAGASVALAVVRSAAQTRELVAAHAAALAAAQGFWIVYPKANKADVNRDSLWPILLEFDMRPVSQIAVDDVWSALRFRPLAPGEVFDRR
jgi:hypothetical protein